MRTEPGLNAVVIDSALRPHINAIQSSVRAGFEFRQLPNPRNVQAVQGSRRWSGAIDLYLAHSYDSALAARFRLEDLERDKPPALWHRHGAVAEVVWELLELPAHGTPGAPVVARAAVPDLWVPVSAR